MAYGWDFDQALSGIGQTLARALQTKWQKEEESGLLNQLIGMSQRTIQAPEQLPAGYFPQPQGALQSGQPRPIPTRQEPTSLGDPSMQNAIMQMMQVNPSLAQSFLAMRQMGQPTYTTKIIPRGAEEITQRTYPGEPPETISKETGQPFTTGWKKVGERSYQGQKYGMFLDTENIPHEIPIGQTDVKPAGGAGKWQAVKNEMGTVIGWANPDAKEFRSTQDMGIGELKPPITSATKTMMEAAPKVKEFVKRIRQSLTNIGDDLGPIGGRWQEFFTGKVGTENKEYTNLRTNTLLLSTLLMRMHVGARGAQGLLEHFKSIMDMSYQSKENLETAMNVIDEYADDVLKPMKKSNSQPSGDMIKVRRKSDGKTGTMPASKFNESIFERIQ